MSERAQMIHMLVRVSRLAAERWGMKLSQAAGLLGSSGALGYIARNFGLFHMEGDEAVLDDAEEYLLSKGVTPYDAS